MSEFGDAMESSFALRVTSRCSLNHTAPEASDSGPSRLPMLDLRCKPATTYHEDSRARFSFSCMSWHIDMTLFSQHNLHIWLISNSLR